MFDGLIKISLFEAGDIIIIIIIIITMMNIIIVVICYLAKAAAELIRTLLQLPTTLCFVSLLLVVLNVL